MYPASRINCRKSSNETIGGIYALLGFLLKIFFASRIQFAKDCLIIASGRIRRNLAVNDPAVLEKENLGAVIQFR